MQLTGILLTRVLRLDFHIGIRRHSLVNCLRHSFRFSRSRVILSSIRMAEPFPLPPPPFGMGDGF